jgi:hypothetical protein
VFLLELSVRMGQPETRWRFLAVVLFSAFRVIGFAFRPGVETMLICAA